MKKLFSLTLCLLLLSPVTYASERRGKATMPSNIEFGEFFRIPDGKTIGDLNDQDIEKLATQDQVLLSAADSYNAEGDYNFALKLLHKMQLTHTSRWCDVAGSSYLGDRQYAKAKEAFECAQAEYAKEGNEKKVRDLQAHIDFLTPKKD